MNKFIRLVLLIIAALLFVAGVGLGYRNFVGAEIACFTAGGLVLVFVFLSQFKRFKGPFGIEGEMWEQEMEEAHEITVRFRNLATAIAKPLIANSVRLGRWDSYLTRREIDNLIREVRTVLENSGSPPEEIEAALSDYRCYTAFDMVAPARKAVKEALDAKVREKHAEMQAFVNPIKAEDRQAHFAAVERWRAAGESTEAVMKAFEISNADSYLEIIRARVNECDLIDESERTDLLSSIQDTFDDLAHFRATGQIRRPDVWFIEPKE